MKKKGVAVMVADFEDLVKSSGVFEAIIIG